MEPMRQTGHREREGIIECTMESNLRLWTTQVCGVLQDSGPLTLAGIARELRGLSANEVAMALGWLAQEGRVRFQQNRGMWEVHMGAKTPCEPRAEFVNRT